MKLRDIWFAKDAWAELAKCKKPPKLAYRMMKFGDAFYKEVNLCSQEHDRLIRQYAGVGENESASLEPGSSEFNQFVAQFMEFLETDSELPTFDQTLEEVVDLLDSQQGNAVSDSSLAILEPLFKSNG